MDATRAPRIELERVSRRFGDRLAVRELDLVLEPERIHALVGENGAGKSTALKMIAGLWPPSAGRVLIDGRPLEPATPDRAISCGIGMVHQHFMLIEPFTALENVVLGGEPVGRLGGIDWGHARAKAAKVAKEAGLEVDLDARVEAMSVGEKQRLEILRVLYRGARALLLDEPTAVLSPVEVGELYATLRRLAGGGATVCVVTHRLDEVARFADEVTAMRKGEEVHAERIDEAARIDPAFAERLTRAIMGGEIPAAERRPPLAEGAEVVLELRGVTLGARLAGIDLTIRAGEIVGVAGVEGNGQHELARVLGGLAPIDGGTIELAGMTELLRDSASPAARVRAARRQGLVVVHDDRHKDELVLDATVADNLVLGDLPLADEAAARDRRFERFAVAPADPWRRAGELSGGNQQKVVMARALDRKLAALVLAQPTRGVDVGTARTIHAAIAAAAEKGAAVLVISADLNELRALCHRIVVLRRGAIVAELEPTASDETIGRAMLASS